MKLYTKNNLAIVIGNALEYYDFMLYGFFATILAPLFFPSDDAVLLLIASMGSYGIGFLARPLGGIFFGHLGDRWGRKNTLSLSLILLTLPTLGLGLMPTYAAIGAWAPFLLILCRLLQGFCLGGETSGAMTYIIENSPPHQKEKASAWLVVSCYAGTLLGTLLGSFFTLSFMPNWGWRLTFITGSLISVVGYYIRRKLKESPDFLAVKEKGEILALPLKDLLKKEKCTLLFSASLCAAVVVPFFLIFVYLNGILTQILHFEPHRVLFLNASLMFFWVLLLPCVGALAQRYGGEKVMKAGLLGMALLSFPLFLFLGVSPTFEGVLLAQLLLSIFASLFSAPTSAFLVRLFPPNKRYSGIAFGYSLGHAIFGGIPPLVISVLVGSFGLYSTPAWALLASCGLGFFAVSRGIFISKAQSSPATLPLA